jgi:hypothetical protein
LALIIYDAFVRQMRRSMWFVALLALPVAARAPLETAIPKGKGWSCPTHDIRDLTMECMRTFSECDSLVDNTMGVLGGERPTCKPAKKAYCFSWQKRTRTRGPEAICYPKLEACNKEQRKMAGDARYTELSECAEHD